MIPRMIDGRLGDCPHHGIVGRGEYPGGMFLPKVEIPVLALRVYVFTYTKGARQTSERARPQGSLHLCMPRLVSLWERISWSGS